jgi:hypothetical protein
VESGTPDVDEEHRPPNDRSNGTEAEHEEPGAGDASSGTEDDGSARADAGSAVLPPTIVGVPPKSWSFREELNLVSPHANVMFTSYEEPEGFSNIESYVAAQCDQMTQQFPGFVQLGVETGRAFGHEGAVLHLFEWAPEGETYLARQLQIYLFHAGRLYTATATAPSDRYAEMEPEILQALGSLRVLPGETAPH